MKIKNGFILREVAGNFIVVPVGHKTIDFNGIVTLNKTGAFIWSILENDVTFDEIMNELQQKFSLDYDLLKLDLNEFIEKLSLNDLLEK